MVQPKPSLLLTQGLLLPSQRKEVRIGQSNDDDSGGQAVVVA